MRGPLKLIAVGARSAGRRRLLLEFPESHAASHPVEAPPNDYMASTASRFVRESIHRVPIHRVTLHATC